MSEIKNYGKSIRARLLNVAKQEEVFYQTILTRYFQERLLYRISQTRYRNNFYLKVQSPNQKIPDRKTKCVIKTHINIKQNVIFGAKLKPV